LWAVLRRISVLRARFDEKPALLPSLDRIRIRLSNKPILDPNGQKKNKKHFRPISEQARGLKMTQKKPDHPVREKVTRGANLRRTRRKQSKKEAHEILEEVASFVANNKHKS
jgi:hypothetical protein